MFLCRLLFSCLSRYPTKIQFFNGRYRLAKNGCSRAPARKTMAKQFILGFVFAPLGRSGFHYRHYQFHQMLFPDVQLMPHFRTTFTKVCCSEMNTRELLFACVSDEQTVPKVIVQPDQNPRQLKKETVTNVTTHLILRNSAHANHSTGRTKQRPGRS